MTNNQDIKKIFSVYGAAFLVMFVVEVVLMCVYPKLELHLLLNSYHTDIQDTFYKYYSVLAEWPLYILGLLPLCWKKYRITIFYAVSEIVAGTISLILKSNITSHRPLWSFDIEKLPLVEGVNMHHSNSFPSGHASTFFVFFTCLALIFAWWYQQRAPQMDKRKKILMYLAMFALFLLAALGAFSRVYLSQHFLMDICVGSLIGFVVPCLFFYFGKNLILKTQNE
jgi:membrane-associated phospholipid phosphatase